MSTLAVQAYDELRAMLLRGALKPGHQLVNRKLAESIGMSLTPVREAVARLSSEGLVEHLPGAGAFVRKISWQEIEQLYDVREAIEPLAASQAALYATASEIAEMKMVVAESFRDIREIAGTEARHADDKIAVRWLESDRRLHAIIFNASRNCWLSRIANDMKLVSLWIGSPTPPSGITVSNAVKTWRCHRRLIRAIVRRDAELAGKLAREHIGEARRSIRKLMAAEAPIRNAAHAFPPVDSSRVGKKAVSARRGIPRGTARRKR